jgi:hypothetical protein
MRTWDKIIWRVMPKACVSFKQSLTQFWHSKPGGNKKGLGFSA